MSTTGKPRKVGILNFIEKKKVLRKFCILTSAKEIDCYNQEVEYEKHKYLTLANLNTCEVKIPDPLKTDEFSINYTDGKDIKSYLLKAQDEIDRRNWIQEVIKTKEVEEIIKLMHHETLSNFAIRALINIANSTDEIKNEIVTHGGLEALFEFKDNVDVEVQSFVSIGFAYLSQTEENKEKLGKYINYLVEIIKGENKMIIHQCLMSIANISTLESNRVKLRNIGAIDLLIKHSVEGDHNFRLYSAIALQHCAKDEKCRELILAKSDNLIECLISWDSKERRQKLPEALHHFLEMLLELSKDPSFYEKKFLMRLLALLQIPPTENFHENRRREERAKGDPVFLIHQSLTHLIAKYAEKSPNAPEFLVHSQYLVLPLKMLNEPKEDELEAQKVARIDIPEYTIDYLFACSSNTNLTSIFESLSIFDFFVALQHPKGKVRFKAAYLLNNFVATTREHKDLGESEVSKITENLVNLVNSEKDYDGLKKDEIKSEVLSIFSHFCTNRLFKQHLPLTVVPNLALRHISISHLKDCTNSLHILSSLTSEFSCRYHIGNEKTFDLFVSLMNVCLKDLDKTKYIIFTLCSTIIANYSTEKRWREQLTKINILSTLTKALEVCKDRALRISVLRALQNLCYDDKIEEIFLKLQTDKKEWPIGKLLVSKSAKLRVASAKTLRNCNSTQLSVSLVENFVTSIIKALKEAKLTDHQVDLLISLRSYLINSSTNFTKDIIPSLCEFFTQKESKFIENLLWCLVEVSKIESLRLDLFQNVQKIIFENIESKNVRISIYSSIILLECSKDDTVKDLMYKDGLILKIFNHLSHSSTIKVIESCLGAISNCFKNENVKKEYATQFTNQLYVFLDFPHKPIQEHTSEIFISNFKKSDGEIVLNEEESVLALINLLSSGAKITNKNPISFKMENEQLILSSPNFLFNFLYANALEQKRNMAKSLAKCSNISSIGKFPELPSYAELAILPSSDNWKSLGFTSEQLLALFLYQNCTGEISIVESKIFREMFPELDYKTVFEISKSSFDKDLFEIPVINVEKMNLDVLAIEQENPVEISYSLLYIGSVGSAITNIPLKGDGIFSYYEVFILNEGTQRTIAVGFTTDTNFQNISHPGWHTNSYGYHSDDGNAYESGKNKVYGEMYGTGDVIGCGINKLYNTIFFTKNGKYLGIAYENVSPDLEFYPCVGMTGPHEHIYLNFGQNPFLWDKNDSVSHSDNPSPLAQDVLEGKVTPQKIENKNFVSNTWKKLIGTMYDTWSLLDPSLSDALSYISPNFGGNEKVHENNERKKKKLVRKKIVKRIGRKSLKNN